MVMGVVINVSILAGEIITKMSDILFLSVKEHAGKIRSNEGFLSATGDLATLTANTGKDMYIARAKVVFFINTAANAITIADTVELKVNGTVIETASTGLRVITTSNSGAGALAFEYEFKNMGHKVAATEIIKLEVTALNANTDVEGFIECFEETTGESPYQASEFI